MKQDLRSVPTPQPAAPGTDAIEHAQPRCFYMCLSVRGAIKNLQSSRAKNSAFNDDHGQPLTRLQAIDVLMDELAKGRETLPMSKGCGNPCKNSAKCDGFDFGPEGGCPGHPIEEGGVA